MKIFLIYLRYWTIRISYLLLALFLILGEYFYTVPQIKIGNYILSNPYFSNTKNISTWLYAVDYFIFIFTVAIIIIAVLILYYNINKRRKEKADKQFLNLFVKELFAYLFMVEEFTDEEKKKKIKVLKKALNTDHSKRLFINTLVDVHSQTKGIVNKKTFRLLKAVKFDYLIYAYLHSPHFKHKLFALKVISEFNLEGYDKYILKLTKRKNSILHAQAIITLLKLKVYGNLLFLTDLKLKLTLWDINLIVKTIQDLNQKDINYTVLIQSAVPEISALGLILARLHKRTELKSEVILRIGSTSKLVNEEAFLTLIAFSSHQSDFDYLIEKFSIATHKAQLMIIQSLSMSSDNVKTIQFLNWIVENKHFTHKTEAIKQLLELDLSSIRRFKQSEDKLIRQSCLQVLDINL